MDGVKNQAPSSMTPVPVTRTLRKLGHDIRDARRRRRIPVAILAQRASISRMTLNKVEKGKAGVSGPPAGVSGPPGRRGEPGPPGRRGAAGVTGRQGRAG